MAPIAPKKRTSTRAKIAHKPSRSSTTGTTTLPSSSSSSFTDQPTYRTTAPFSDSSTFRTTKKDKRQIKHSVFLSKIEKPRSKTLKRRRPSKKLITNLDSLVDALPDAGDGTNSSNAKNDKHREMMASQVNIIRQKSLKHKPGAMKRKETLDRRERERFARNLAQLAAVASPSSSTTAGEGSALKNNNAPVEVTQPQTRAPAENAPTSNRWAALRNFISQTMDQNPEFKNTPPT
ncbi:hypothetical protein ACJ72_01849 [Emergomyces africanus]|uniref:Ribosome biogenesis protein SLX9 n=1 Tax=Emergomyces africanus TaxID=1955775 RepID=A0A1B7P459_9EURO|nr:hypothetical protein ACJ72_01849 [Emergomyces africanus]